ncbi:hypothetical protein Tco_0152684 [Tanacetum coccineum]
MLDKHLFMIHGKAEWKLYMRIGPHGRNYVSWHLLEIGPLVWPSITEDGSNKANGICEHNSSEAIQADAKSKQFNHSPRPSQLQSMLYYRFAVICTATNVDHLQFSFYINMIRHAIEVRLMHERNPDPLALVASHQLTQPAYQSHLHPHQQSLSQQHVSPYQSSQFLTPYQHHQYSTPLSSTYPTNEYQSTVHHNVYSQQPSIPQLEYAPTTYQQQQPEFSQPDSSLVVPVFQKGDDPIDAINHMMSFLTAVVTSGCI